MTSLLSSRPRRRRQRSRAAEQTSPAGLDVCIDLTSDTQEFDANGQLIDLTSVSDTPVSTNPGRPIRLRRRFSRRSLRSSPYVLRNRRNSSDIQIEAVVEPPPSDSDNEGDEDDEDVLPVFDGLYSRDRVRPETNNTDEPEDVDLQPDLELISSKKKKRTPSPSPAPASSNEDEHTPNTKLICPVCLEGIQKPGKNPTSTDCGHLFCKECIVSAISSQGKCPTCRRRLTKKRIHPIFI